MTMWGGRFQAESSQLFKQMNDSLSIDYQLVEQDILGSKVWAESLCDANIISEDELKVIEEALEDIREEAILDLAQITLSQAEDIHSWVEQKLVAKIGGLGKKLHTGRSRNDQVLTDVKLWCQLEVKAIDKTLTELCEVLTVLSKKFAHVVMPSYTHLQRAQPITFGYWIDAFLEMMKRDQQRMTALFALGNLSPLGSSAISGTAFDIDREKIASQLGFSSATNNALDTVSDRDFVSDLLFCSCSSLLHLSRVAEDLIFFNSQEAGFIVLDDSVTSGSSLMPQKKNPDALEIIRGKSAEGFALLSQMLMSVKGLPLGYNKDLQQDKKVLFQSMSIWKESLLLAQQVLLGLNVNSDVMRKAVVDSFSNATELADYLVSKGVPFRDAHDQTGQLVLIAEKNKMYLRELSLEEFQRVNPLINKDLYQWLDVDHAISRRQVKGGVGAFVSNSELQTTFSLDASEFSVTPCYMSDIDSLFELIDYWVKKGEHLPRSKEEIAQQLTSFWVIRNPQKKIVGCGSLYIYDETLVEFRSVGMHPEYRGKGLGKVLLETLKEKAKKLKLKSAFVLTRSPDFFKSSGFVLTSIECLPKKVMKDCQFCPKKDACDEQAWIFDLN